MHIAVLSPYVNYRRRPAIVPSGKRRFVKTYFLDRLGREHREETKTMVDFIDRAAVKEYQIFVATTAAHKHRRRAANALLNTRRKLYGLDDVGLAQNARSVFNDPYRNVHTAHTS